MAGSSQFRLPFGSLGRLEGLGVVVILALVAAPVAVSSFQLFSLSTILFLATLAVTWDFFTGLTGYFNFGHMFLVGCGGYTSALLVGEAGVTLPVAIVVATLFTTVVGTLAIAGPSLRLSGIYFAAITFIVTIYAQDLVILFSDVTGGLGGYIFVAPLELELQGVVPAGIDLDLVLYFIALANFLVILGLMVLMSKSELGIIMRGIRQEEELVSSLGVNPTKYKLVAFGLTAAFTGFTGAVWTHFFVTLTPTLQLSLDVMVDIIVAATIGGMGTVVGPAIGTGILEGIEFGLRMVQSAPFFRDTLDIQLAEYRRLLSVGFALAFLYYYPGGVYRAMKNALDGSEGPEGGSD